MENEIPDFLNTLELIRAHDTCRRSTIEKAMRIRADRYEKSWSFAQIGEQYGVGGPRAKFLFLLAQRDVWIKGHSGMGTITTMRNAIIR